MTENFSIEFCKVSTAVIDRNFNDIFNLKAEHGVQFKINLTRYLLMQRLQQKKIYTVTEIAKMFDIHLITVKRYIKKLNLNVKKPVTNGSSRKSILTPLKVTDSNYLKNISVTYWR